MAANLQATISADPRQFYDGFRRADAFAQSFGASIGKRLMKGFGAGAMAASVLYAVKDIILAPFKAAETISSGAKALGVTAEEYQMVAAGAEAANLSIDKFLDQLRQHPEGVQGAIEALQQYRDQVKLTNEDVDNLGVGGFWRKAAKRVGAGVTSVWKGVQGGLVDVLTHSMLLEAGLKGPKGSRKSAVAMHGLMQDIQQQRLNAQAPSQGLVNQLTDTDTTKKTAPAAPSVSWYTPQVTSRQQLGAYVGTEATQIVSEIRRQTAAIERATEHVERADRTIQTVFQ